MKKIFILLPHKDQFIKSYSGSASIWVKDFFMSSKFKNNTTIFGSTNNLKDVIIKKNYKNLKIPSVKFRSRTNIYLKEFASQLIKGNPSIVEIHNRPSYLLYLHKKFKKIKYFLIIHNDPQNLEGSSSLKQRIELLNICEQIYFVSLWVEDKFFEGIEKNYYSNFKTIYPSIKKITNKPKKENLIIFSGKLNSAKGFDIFCSAMIKILNKYKNWKAMAIGDEPRQNIFIKHKNLLYTGWIQHEKVLKIYNKSSITVVPSSWEEPFGRSSLEAGSRGNAVIISRKGGLPETIATPIILSRVTSECIFKEVDELIKNKKKLSEVQKINLTNPLHIIKNNVAILDKDRNQFLNPIKNFNINKNAKLKILHVFNRAEKIGGRIYFISTGKKLENGIIRLGHDVEGLSDRDIINYNPVRGKDVLNKILLEKAMYYRPDLVLMGHVHNIYNKTYEKIKHINKNVVISQWYEDNLSFNGPDFYKNLDNLKVNFSNIDNFFISTHPDEVSAKNPRVNYQFLPTPVDRNIEKLSIYNNKVFIHDVFIAISHGVNRGNIKTGKVDEREGVIKKILKLNKDIKFDIYGFNDRNPVWSENFYSAISNSYMAVNINRGKSKKYSSSNRIASLMGNGLLTFMDNKKQFDHFFNKDEMIFFDNNQDLSEKLSFYKKNTSIQKKIAFNGQKKYFKLFNCVDVAEYIIEKSMNPNTNYKPAWE